MNAIRIAPPLLLAVVVAVSGCASMSGNKSADFKVELDPATCQFTGGSDGAGNVEVTSGTGKKKIKVKLTTNQGYSIESVTFSGPGKDQMKPERGGALEKDIVNSNTGPADVKYSVKVRNDGTGAISDCDPRIINR